jgi:hypothetical protein
MCLIHVKGLKSKNKQTDQLSALFRWHFIFILL